MFRKWRNRFGKFASITTKPTIKNSENKELIKFLRANPYLNSVRNFRVLELIEEINELKKRNEH